MRQMRLDRRRFLLGTAAFAVLPGVLEPLPVMLPGTAAVTGTVRSLSGATVSITTLEGERTVTLAGGAELLRDGRVELASFRLGDEVVIRVDSRQSRGTYMATRYRHIHGNLLELPTDVLRTTAGTVATDSGTIAHPISDVLHPVPLNSLRIGTPLRITARYDPERGALIARRVAIEAP